jgi:hypothetical protein
MIGGLAMSEHASYCASQMNTPPGECDCGMLAAAGRMIGVNPMGNAILTIQADKDGYVILSERDIARIADKILASVERIMKASLSGYTPKE